jgi:hypothetical protein
MRSALQTTRRRTRATLLGCWTALLLVTGHANAAAGAAGAAAAAEALPMKQGLHQWPALGGKLYLVVGTYQDIVHFRRSYSFYFKAQGADTWHQVGVVRKRGLGEFPWESAVAGENTLADGIVVARREGVYFVVGEKRVKNGYADKGDITATWNKLGEAGDSEPDGPQYRMAPVFTRLYPNTSFTVETVLERETTLRPAK